ncbi:hypothetical protein SDRG_04265 [Saprolegnia diclina VS20]|uniref:Uncharacterized protein n=1 Tax=Saprolegnia diclina (strain VS20) TaxID=1156394 RepID=T0QX10_SAPDV|nr:hypothetical protein SDRG_04265 [Saprolegnia diclina VS20]EQC38560.1 hypothetical protein SDRG_04265 [Saprolegnia diclina VS20]|eukprot:XP_008608152.1 hypothetical protein SDRG_04265 [Saprolegnia diclina VS20]
MEVWWETKEDCLWLVYYLVFIAPLHALLIGYLERQGKQVTPSKAIIWIASLALMSTFLPLLVRKKLSESSPYRLLSVSRYGPKYVWAQQYSHLKQYFTSGQMSPDIWAVFDAAYDKLYDDGTRRAFEVWGPNFETLLSAHMPYNLALFYVLWLVGIYATTVGRKYAHARDLATAGLLVVLVFEMSIRFMGYNPLFMLLPQTTPNEMILLVHALFPAWVLGYTSFKRIFFVDMLQHKNDCLEYALATNEKTKKALESMRVEIRKLKDTKETTSIQA